MGINSIDNNKALSFIYENDTGNISSSLNNIMPGIWQGSKCKFTDNGLVNFPSINFSEGVELTHPYLCLLSYIVNSVFIKQLVRARDSEGVAQSMFSFPLIPSCHERMQPIFILQLVSAMDCARSLKWRWIKHGPCHEEAYKLTKDGDEPTSVK